MVSFGGDFGPEGLRSGIYTNQNAAAFAARSKDALFISFRGTNDNTGEEGPPNPFTNTPDESHWVGKKDHLDLFADLFSALSTYVGNLANGISTVYVVGHSLGGGLSKAREVLRAQARGPEHLAQAPEDCISKPVTT